MNAMEIMDPKMDPNCESKRAQRQIRSFQQLLDVCKFFKLISIICKNNLVLK